MMDESNDKTDKSCIILVRVIDSEKGETCTRFLDMPVINKFCYTLLCHGFLRVVFKESFATSSGIINSLFAF